MIFAQAGQLQVLRDLDQLAVSALGKKKNFEVTLGARMKLLVGLACLLLLSGAANCKHLVFLDRLCETKCCTFEVETQQLTTF